jgi:hypothetical protein
MKSLLDLFLRSVGLGRRKPKTVLGKVVRHINQVTSLIAFVWFALQLFPQIIFPQKLIADGITIYARTALPPEAAVRITETKRLLSASELAVPGRAHRIFLCNNPVLFGFLVPSSPRSFAFEMPGTGNIFIAQADLTQNVCRSRAPAHNTRSFSSVAAHEITHELIQHRLGFVKAWRLPGWVAEGYPEYVARESSFPAEEALRLLSAGREDPAPAFKYAVYRQMVMHAIDVEGYSFDQLVGRAGDARTIKAQMLAAIPPRR